jgi:hypothetical protein
MIWCSMRRAQSLQLAPMAWSNRYNRSRPTDWFFPDVEFLQRASIVRIVTNEAASKKPFVP